MRKQTFRAFFSGKKMLASAAFIVSLLIGGVSLLSQSEIDVSIEMARESFKGGLKLFNDYSYLGAVEYFRQALNIYPEYHTAREYLARSYRLAGYTDEALNEWQLLYDISHDPSVKRRIDMLRLNNAILPDANSISELIEYKRFFSRDISHYQFPGPVDIACDRNKMVYITSYSNGKIVKLDPDGKGLAVKKPEMSSKIFGIDIQDERILYADFANDMLYLADTDLSTKLKFGSSGSGDGQFHGPQGVAFGEDESIYAVDSGNHRVQKFSITGSFLFSFGKKGNYEGEFYNPTDVAVRGGLVYVSDTGNGRISVYDDSGNFLHNVYSPEIKSPRCITFKDAVLHIADSTSGLIYYDTETGAFTKMESWNDGKDRYSRLYATTYDRDGYFYALDHDAQSVYIFSPLEKRYTNLDLSIYSVDLNSFPTVAFFVAVRQQDGTPVYGLKASDFAVIEDSAPITQLHIDYFNKQDRGLRLVFCVDSSAGMEKWRDELLWSADLILREFRRNDSVKVLNFNDDYYTANDYDWSRRRTMKAMEDKKFAGGRRIGRVLYNSVTDLVKKDEKRGVILFTDGTVTENDFSQYSINCVIGYARNHFVPITIVSLGSHSDILQRIATSTGGEFILARDMDRLKGVYGHMKKQEENRYVVLYQTFKNSEFSGWWSDVTIEVESKGQSGLGWGGYFVP